jgi:peptidoglycan hydrolase-like protein with peptidoglycan-binding domain
MSVSTMNQWPLAGVGDRGHLVRTLQHLLRVHGVAVLVDGVVGAQTEAGIRSFQRYRGLPVDRVVGPATWTALVRQVRQGCRGEAVRGLQEELQLRGLACVQVDGIFGPQTAAAVRGYQAAVELQVDGVVGEVTWRALVSGRLSY